MNSMTNLAYYCSFFLHLHTSQLLRLHQFLPALVNLRQLSDHGLLPPSKEPDYRDQKSPSHILIEVIFMLINNLSLDFCLSLWIKKAPGNRATLLNIVGEGGFENLLPCTCRAAR